MGRKPDTRKKKDSSSDKRKKTVATARVPLSPKKARVFLAITLALPFLLLDALEIGLRIGKYGVAARLAQVAPTYAGLGEWMSTLGMTPR